MLEKFTVIDLIKTRSASVATLTGNAIKFNRQTAEELHFAPFVQFLINTKEKQFAIRSCKQDAPNAVKFSRPADQQKYAIKITSAAIVDLLLKLSGLNAEDNWNIPGVYLADEDALVYDLGAAYKPTKRGRWATKKETVADSTDATSASNADS